MAWQQLSVQQLWLLWVETQQVHEPSPFPAEVEWVSLHSFLHHLTAGLSCCLAASQLLLTPHFLLSLSMMRGVVEEACLKEEEVSDA